ILVSLGPIADGDIYWHLAAGRWMVEHRALLRVDPFTVSAGGRAWIDVHWLFQLAVAAWHGWTGFVGLMVAKAALIAGAAVLLTRAAERAAGARGRLLCAITLGASLIAARQLLPLRPIIVTVLFLAVTLDMLEGWRAGTWSTGRWRLARPLGLAALQVVWVSCQGLAPLGPALIAAYLVGGALARAGQRRAQPAAATHTAGLPPRRPLMTALVLVGLASFVTPYGLAAVVLPVRLLARLSPRDANVFSTSVAENIPPFVLARTAPAEIAHFTQALVLAGAALLVWRPRFPAAHLIALGGFVGLALIATRNIPLFYLVAAPLLSVALANRVPATGSPGLARPLGRASARLAALGPWFGRLRARAGRLLPVAGAALLGAEVILAGVALAREAPIAQPTPFRFPTESVRRLAAQGASGPVFAPDHHGGFLTFTLPQVRPYIDTRLVLHTAREYADFLALLDHPTSFDALAEREGFRYVVLTTSNPDRYLPLAMHLLNDPAWSLLYTDGSELLFSRRSEGAGIVLRDRSTVDAIRAELRERFPGDTPIFRMATLNLARLLVVAGVPAEAERALAGERSRAAVALRARARFVAGDLAAAETLARVLLGGGRRDEDAPELALLGEIALARRRPDESRGWARRALAADPYAPEARSLLSRLETLSHRTD
ncbi:MAG TPA: hypothetical protein VIU64_16300, partial [Polyangia bacterium]